MDVNGIRIVPTYNCNLNCQFCYQSIRSNSIVLDPDRLERRINSLIEKNFKPIYITFMGGEFTCLKNSLEYIKIVNKYYPFSRKSITTNGTASIEYYKKLRIYEIDNVTFSFNGNQELLSKITLLNDYHLYTVRVNIFLDHNDPGRMNTYLNEFAIRNIKLTFCTDIRSDKIYNIEELMLILKIKHQDWNITEYDNHIIFRNERMNYSFWVFDHRNNYKNDNYIILPNGAITFDFRDMVNCYGAK